MSRTGVKNLLPGESTPINSSLPSFLRWLPLNKIDLDQIVSEALAQQAKTDDPSYRIYTEYQDDPVGFCEDILGEHFTPDVERVMESVKDYVYTVARSANATGKTHSAARLAIWFYKCFPNAQVYTTAAQPFANLQKLLWGEIGKVTRKHPQLFIGDRNVSMNISRPADAIQADEFVTGVTIPSSGAAEEREARFSGKHAPHLFFIVDEADAVPYEVFKGIESCISGGHVRVLLMFNPRRKAGKPYQLERDQGANVISLSAFSHPNVITGKDLFPGAVTRERTLQRINAWTRPLQPGEGTERECFQVPDYLVGAVGHSDKGDPYPPLAAGWRKITSPEFYYMVLAEYPPQSSMQLISEEWYYNARSRWDAYVAIHGEKPPANTRAKLGADIAEFGVDMNAICLRYGGWVARMGKWSGVDTLVTGDRIAQVVRDNLTEAVYTDATGLGSGVAPQVRRSLQRSPVTRYKFNTGNIYGIMVGEAPTIQPLGPDGLPMGQFRTLRDQLCWSAREWLRTDPGAMLPPGDELRDELLAITYDVGTKWVTAMSKDELKKAENLGRSPNEFDALCLTFAPVRTFKMGLV